MENEKDRFFWSSPWTWIATAIAGVAAWVVGDKKNWWGFFEEEKKTKDGDKKSEEVTVDKDKNLKEAPEITPDVTVTIHPQPALDKVALDGNKKESQNIYINTDGMFVEKPEAGVLVVNGVIKKVSGENIFEVQSFAKIGENGVFAETYHNFDKLEKSPSFKVKINDLPPVPLADGSIKNMEIEANSEQSKKVIDYLRKNWEGKASDKDLSILVDKAEYIKIASSEANNVAKGNDTSIGKSLLHAKPIVKLL